MTRAVRIGCQVLPQHSLYPPMAEAVQDIDALGADLLTTWDHFYPLNGPADGEHYECWTLMSAWAAMTRHVEIGALVSSIGYRNPDLVADMSRTIDHISDGRFILGLGAGWFERDYNEYGYEFGTAGTRLAHLEAGLPRIETRWGKLNPAPTRKIPVMIGGGGEKKTLRYTARHADIWHGFGTPEELRHKCAVLDDWCAAEGRNPADIERSTFVDGDPEALGPALVAEGVTLLMVQAKAPDFDLSELRAWLQWRDAYNAEHGLV